MIRIASLVFALISLASVVHAHELQPGYLELQMTAPDEYAVTWKVPSVKGRPMAIVAKLPDNCTPQYADQLVWDGAAFLARWSMKCPGGIEGGTITIEGLDKTSTDVLVRFEYANGEHESRRLTPNRISFAVPTQPNRFEVARTYLTLGYEHLLSGFDHLLFVLALLILVKGKRRILATVTAFTVAHSLTLAAATLGLVSLSGPPVEAVIALSIVFLAAEIRHSQKGTVGWTEQHPWLVAFSFGLLHGFGFAGALSELGLPSQSIPLALLLFNVGVELGQLAFVLATFGVLFCVGWTLRRARLVPPKWAKIIPPYAIGITSAFWVVQRVATFF